MLLIKKLFFGVFWGTRLVNLVAVFLLHFDLLSWVEKAFGNPYYVLMHYLNGAGGLDRHCFPCRGVVDKRGDAVRQRQEMAGRKISFVAGGLPTYLFICFESAPKHYFLNLLALAFIPFYLQQEHCSRKGRLVWLSLSLFLSLLRDKDIKFIISQVLPVGANMAGVCTMMHQAVLNISIIPLKISKVPKKKRSARIKT